MTKFHPAPEQLKQFAQGALSPVEAIMISAHCDMCARCQHVVKTETAQQANHVLSDSPSNYTEHIRQDLDSMLASITQLPKARPFRSSRIPPSTIELDGRRFSVPRTLRKFIPTMGNWSGLVGRLWQAPVDIGASGAANFIYMGPGGGVPEHTHRGFEFTLVIDGEFDDGINHYAAGDFIAMDEEHTHTPRSDDPHGCLVFSVLDQPLHFTSGIARLLNPFSHVFFR